MGRPLRIVRRLLAGSWPVRLWRAVHGLFRGLRLHPTVVFLGGSRISLGRGTAVGPRCRFDAMTGGTIEVGPRCWFDSDVDLQTESAIHIGEGSTVQRRCSIQGQSRLGRGCILAPNVFISSGTHPFREIPHLPIRQQEAILASDVRRARALDRPVWIQDDCWLGTNVVVCPGVVIAKGSVVGANSVVLEDVPPYSVVAGAPARVVGKRLEWHPPASVSATIAEDQIYVLAGRWVAGESGDVSGWVAGVDDPIHIALRRGSTATIEYFAHASACIRVNDRDHEFTAGRGTLKVLLTGDLAASDTSTLRIESTSASPFPEFVILGASIEVA